MQNRATAEDSEWFELDPTETLPPGPWKKLRLITDAQFPSPVADELRAAKVDVLGPKGLPLHGKDDSHILDLARRKDRILLTFDQDFWDDQRHPLQRTPGIIILSVSPGDTDSALRAFGLVYGAFAKEFPGDWWTGLKIRATPEMFTLRIWSYDGQIRAWQTKILKGRLVARQVQGPREDFE